MKTLVLLGLLGLALCVGCANLAIVRELAEVSTELERERAARREVERELAAANELLDMWEWKAKGVARFDRAEYIGLLDQCIRAVQRCLDIPPLREAFGEPLHEILTLTQGQRRAMNAADGVPSNQLVNALPDPAESRALGCLLTLELRQHDGASKRALEGLIRSQRELASYIESCK